MFEAFIVKMLLRIYPTLEAAIDRLKIARSLTNASIQSSSIIYSDKPPRIKPDRRLTDNR